MEGDEAAVARPQVRAPLEDGDPGPAERQGESRADPGRTRPHDHHVEITRTRPRRHERACQGRRTHSSTALLPLQRARPEAGRDDEVHLDREPHRPLAGVDRPAGEARSADLVRGCADAPRRTLQDHDVGLVQGLHQPSDAEGHERGAFHDRMMPKGRG